MDSRNYDSLRFLGCFVRIIAGDDININQVIQRIIKRLTIYNETDKKYFFRTDFKLLKNNAANSEIQLGRGYTDFELHRIFENKLSINLRNSSSVKGSLFRSRVNVINSILNKKFNNNDELHDDNYYNYDSFFVKSNNFDPGEYGYKGISDDILKNHHDMSLEITRSFFLWQDMFEIIILESFFMEIPAFIWKIMFSEHKNLMDTLRSNIELSIFIWFCILKLNAIPLMYGLMSKISAFDHMKYNNFFNHDPNTEKIILSPKFVLFNFAFYHSNFRETKYGITDLFNHLLSKKSAACSCSFCHDYNYFFKQKNDLVNIPSIETIIYNEDYHHTIIYYLSILKKVLYLCRLYYGNNAIHVIEDILLSKNDYLSQDISQHDKILYAVYFANISGMKKTIEGESNTYDISDKDDYINYELKNKPLICLPKWKHFKYCKNIMPEKILKDVNVFKINKLKYLHKCVNFELYFSQYFTNGFMSNAFNFNITDTWHVMNVNDKNPKIRFFKYKCDEEDHVGLYMDNGIFFDVLFCFFNNVVLSNDSINYYLKNDVKISDLVTIISKSIDIKGHDVHIDSLLNRIGTYGLCNILNIKNINFLDSDYERTLVFSNILSRFQKEHIWYHLISPYIEKNNIILNVDTLELTNFPETGVNFYASLQSFFGNYDVASMTVIHFKTIIMIEKKLKKTIYYDEQNKTYMSMFFMMPCLKRCIKKAYKFYSDNQNKEYIPICIFDGDYIEICKMFFSLCCMDIFTNEEAISIFLSIRVNTQIRTINQRISMKKTPEEKKMVVSNDNNVDQLVSSLMYISCFSKKFNMNFENGIAIYTFDDILNDKLLDDEPFGNYQYRGNISLFQKMLELDDIYLNHASFYLFENNQKKKTKKKNLKNHYFPIPIFIDNNSKNIGNTYLFADFKSMIESYNNEPRIMPEGFEKKDLGLYIIPDNIISFLKSIHNCNRTYFEI